MSAYNAWHGDAALKEKYVQAAVAHREADHYLQGTFAEGSGETFKACSVGCSLATFYGEQDADDHNYGDHALLARTLGVPEFIIRMQDSIFEELPEVEAIGWTERLFTAIPVGADLSLVQPRFLLALQRHNLERVDLAAHPDVYAAIGGAISVLEAWIATGRADESAARSAEGSAQSAAWSAARLVAESVAESVRPAQSAAWSAARSVRSAEWSARSAEWSARSAEGSAQSAAWSAARLVAESVAESVRPAANILIATLELEPARPIDKR